MTIKHNAPSLEVQDGTGVTMQDSVQQVYEIIQSSSQQEIVVWYDDL